MQFDAGALNVKVFEHVAGVYRQMMQTLNLTALVPCQLAEDETKIDPSVEFDRATHGLVGFCGTNEAAHKCDVGGARVKLPFDDSTGERKQSVQSSLREPGVGSSGHH
jgi:hypothetical protein